MTLRVSLEDFAEAVHRYGGGLEVYVAGPADALTATALNDETGVVVTTIADDLDKLRKLLSEAGLILRDGTLEQPDIREVHVVGVAYSSDDAAPGLWMDAFPYPPSQLEVLRTFYEELIETGELSDVPFEQFRRHLRTTVVTLTPDELSGYASKKRAAPKPET